MKEDDFDLIAATIGAYYKIAAHDLLGPNKRRYQGACDARLAIMSAMQQVDGLVCRAEVSERLNIGLSSIHDMDRKIQMLENGNSEYGIRFRAAIELAKSALHFNPESEYVDLPF